MIRQKNDFIFIDLDWNNFWIYFSNVFVGYYKKGNLWLTRVATGLYYLSELVEEYSVLSKKIIKYSLVAVLAFHFLLWLEGEISEIYSRNCPQTALELYVEHLYLEQFFLHYG